MRKFPAYKTPLKLNLSCANKTLKGYLNIDIRDCGQEMVWDIRDGLPFPDSSVEEVFISHTLEHLDDDDSIETLREMLRVLKPKGKAIVRVPHVISPTAFYVGHKTFWNESKVEALTRSEVSLGNFVIIENHMQDGQLFFSFQKLT